MSGKHVAKNQPSSFAFTDENKKKIEGVLKKYPESKKKECGDASFIYRSKTK